MIRSAKDTSRIEIIATDGRAGSVDDFIFDDRCWSIRHLVVDTGTLVKGRRILISPRSVKSSEWNEHRLLLSISREQVTESPPVDPRDPTSFSAVSGCMINAADGQLGHVDDFLFDARTWTLRYFVVDTSYWWFGRHVLVAPQWIRQAAWADRSMSASIRRQRMKSAPQFDNAASVARGWEISYYRHLRQPGYWLDEGESGTARHASSG